MRRIKPKAMAEVNMVPMIDVMLVLVLILMLCAPLIEQQLKIELPDVAAGKTTKPEPKKPWVLSMDRHKQVVLKAPSGKKAKCSVHRLKTCLQLWPQKAPLVEFRADRRLSYGDVMQVMSQLQAKGVSGLSLVYLPNKS